MGPFHMSKVTKYKLIPSEMVAFELSSGNKRDGLSTLQSNFNLFDHNAVLLIATRPGGIQYLISSLVQRRTKISPDYQVFIMRLCTLDDELSIDLTV